MAEEDRRIYTVAALPLDSRADDQDTVQQHADIRPKDDLAADPSACLSLWTPDPANWEKDFHPGPITFALSGGFPALVFTATLFTDLIDALESREALGEMRLAAATERQQISLREDTLFTKTTKWEEYIKILKQGQHDDKSAMVKKIDLLQRALNEANRASKQLREQELQLERKLRDAEARWVGIQDRILMQFNAAFVQLGMFQRLCNFSTPAHPESHEAPRVPQTTQNNPNDASACPAPPRRPSAQLVFEMSERQAELRRIEAEFDQHHNLYEQELQDYILSQIHRPDGDDLEKEFGQIWFQRRKGMTRKLDEAEKVYKDAKDKVDAAGIIVDPPDNGIDGIPEAPMEQSISSRKRKRIEDWVDCTNEQKRSRSEKSLKSNPSATWSAKEGDREYRQKIDEYNKFIGRER
ncbi:hypothetical protein K491DRAFT_723148 [Lophiostoma macrostomum CBS 122681]|uniref:Uncharacterized protein n=1 Tax=Lophiostoma macrostomum CBS 122681 TaxID=1314788 RepID=A0A6A6SJK9_9PLEO|nr:hypothetical protein K491DRAFT_723148 [Lophiostoma macrostomum CBS 122681]